MRQGKSSTHPASGRRHRVAKNVEGAVISPDDLGPAMVDALQDILREENRNKNVA